MHLLRYITVFLLSLLSSAAWASCSGVPDCDPALDASTLAYTVSTVVEKLDVTSFRNSIGPRRQGGKHTFRDYGFVLIQSGDRRAVVREAGGPWEFIITLLGSEPVTICLEDKARNGGSYHTQHAYVLTPAEDGLLQASFTENSACPEFAR